MKSNRNKAIILIILLGLALPFYIGRVYYLHIAIMIYINIILAMGFSLLYSVGLITLGASAFWGVGAYTSALLVIKTGMSFWAALPISALFSGIVGFLLGLLIVRYPGVGFLIFTMVFNFLFQRIWASVPVFGGWGGIISIPTPNPIGVIDFSSKIHFYYLCLFLLLLNIVLLYSLYESRIGKAWRAIKLDPRLAATAGINLFAYRLAAFVLACTFAGLAGSFFAHYSGTIMPSTFDQLKSIHIQVYAILGGLGYYIVGPITGAALFTLLPEILRISPEIEPYFTGIVVIVVVIFLPGGIAGTQVWISTLLHKFVVGIRRKVKMGVL